MSGEDEIDMASDKTDAPPAKSRKPQQRRSTRVDVDGWINLDKPVGVTSTQAVAHVKYLFNAKKAGHAGTLDPLASGVLPIAFGEATKTVPIVQDGAKRYQFTVEWGAETDTDDAEGQPVARSERRPSREEIEAALPQFVGLISQTPPSYSAIRIAGERAYDLARSGESFAIAPRPILIHRLDLVAAAPGEARFEAECGKGAYVRALARDLGRALGCFGHVTALRRMRVGPFSVEAATTLETLRDSLETRLAVMLPVDAGLTELPRIAVDRHGAGILRRGQKLLLRGADVPAEGRAYATCFGAPVAFGVVENGCFVSTRVFNLPL